MTLLLQFSAATAGKKLEGSEMVDPPWAYWVRYLYVPYGQDAAMGIDSAILNAIIS